jgi:prepilin-type N-terminal cleavage/methylation domain-containing protein
MGKKVQKANLKDGFTIIEVVLVLAIAGLIFLMVFIALPALQRSQRDTQRKDDIARLQTALNNFQANNRGALPTGVTGTTGSATVAGSPAPTATNNTWQGFYAKYLLVNASGQADEFNDPDGTPYNLVVRPCGTAVNTACNNQPQATFDGNAHNIYIYVKAVCNGEVPQGSSGDRKVAMAYKLEGGGVTCLNN